MIPLKDIWRQGTSWRRLAVTGVLAAIALSTCAALWWLLAKRDALLFGQLRETDAAEITASLDGWKVPYHFTADGSGILVPADQVHPLRMRLVSAGVPKGGHIGFELFDKEDFGVTEFAQRINYQRALQGEIERTIAALPGIADVRVHLSIRRPGTFLAEERESKASVALTLLPGAELSTAQVRGIRSLVASAVDGLAPESVVVVGPGGLQLPGSMVDADSSGNDESAQRLSIYYEAQVRKVLAGFAGGKDAAVSVNVVLNFDKVKTTSERLLANGAEPGLVTRRSSNTDRTPEGAAGLTNEQVEYAHGTQTEEVTRAGAHLERLGVAVVLQHALAEPEQQRLQRLIATAVGADTSRGDNVEVATGSAKDASAAGPAQQPHEAAITTRPPAMVTVDRTTIGRWSGLAWLLTGGMTIVGLLLGYGWGRHRTKAITRPRLNREQSERATQQIRVWISGSQG